MKQEVTMDPLRVEAAIVLGCVICEAIDGLSPEAPGIQEKHHIDEAYRQMDGRVDKATLKEIARLGIDEFFFLATNGDEEVMARLGQALRTSIDEGIKNNELKNRSPS
ncbi:hypothetical protein SG34_030075 [Thalassomonas viridans]|uniref:Uncharacterized protein n=1 Tax=Thalassomonas viridans TaxID=137584 RepID=A0AAF0CAV6_9GAMM|nr:hypothetical protein [Thalassomonas viridans]WDE09027.1 hypothetical protein SG34_030075 [Thalassomonas viridans]